MTEESAGVFRLSGDDATEVTDILCESFFDYPVMRFILGGDAADYRKHLKTLIHFFVMARVLRGEDVIGAGSKGGLAAAALVSRADGRVSPPELCVLREQLWAELGAEARARYEAFGTACAPFQVEAPHVHLNMIGVRRKAQGEGLGRALIEHVHRLSREDPESVGVTLSTEDEANLPLYEHFGYEIVGQAEVAARFTTWSFFRPD